jgi:hypothetical protein
VLYWVVGVRYARMGTAALREARRPAG